MKVAAIFKKIRRTNKNKRKYKKNEQREKRSNIKFKMTTNINSNFSIKPIKEKPQQKTIKN